MPAMSGHWYMRVLEQDSVQCLDIHGYITCTYMDHHIHFFDPMLPLNLSKALALACHMVIDLMTALERTFLAYIRTSNALASLSIAIFQLTRLSSSSSTSSPASPLPPGINRLQRAATLLMMLGAVIVTLVGCERFLIGQKMVEIGRCRGGGFDLVGVGGWFAVVSCFYVT